MAKKKKQQTTKSQKQVSPERYIKDNARKLPIGKCYVNKNWQANGLAHILITRQRPNGEFVVGDYIVDTFCLGVKDAFYTMRWSQTEIDRLLKEWQGCVEIPYEEAHNIIYGAVSFAEDAGISPHRDFNIAQYILEEDTDEIPLIDYEFGRDGKYFLMVGVNGKERIYINTLINRLGDRFDYVLPDDDEYDEYDEYDDYEDNDDDVVSKAATTAMMKAAMEKMASRKQTTDEPYNYVHPTYPTELNVKHEFIAKAFADKNNFYRLPQEIIDRILSLPVEESVADIHNIVMYWIGKTYEAIDNQTIEYDENPAIMHALIMLSALKSPEGLETVLEIMRQNGDFADYHLGDLAPEVIPQALYACCRENLQPMLDYMYTPGFESYMRTNCLDALAMIAQNEHARRAEVIEIIRQLLVSMIDRLPKLEACDGTFAGFVMSMITDLKATELLPEVTAVFETGCVDDMVTGDLQSITDELEGRKNLNYRTERHVILDYDALYRRIESFQ